MNSINKTFLLVFLGICIFDILVMIIYPPIRIVSKPLILLSLIYFFVINCGYKYLLFLTGLVFALLGDVFLIFSGEMYFMLGLGSFLIMQIIYSINFFKQGIQINLVKGIGILIALAVTIFLILYLKANLGDLLVPVIVYAFTIWTMVTGAILRKNSLPGYSVLVLGALLFMVSDGVLAYGKFVSSFAGQGIIVMTTYMAAQYFIVTSMVKSKRGRIQ